MLLIALQFDFYEGNPWFTDPASQIPPKIAYTVLIGGATLLSAPYIAEEILFSNKTIIFSQSIDRSSFGLSTKAINWAYNS